MKLTNCLCLALLLAAHASAAETLIFPQIKIQHGSSGTGSVVYQGSGNTLAGLQFDLRYDSELLKITPRLAAGPASAGKMLNFNVLPDGTLRVVVMGFNQTVIATGAVVDLSVETVPIKNVIAERNQSLD